MSDLDEIQLRQDQIVNTDSRVPVIGTNSDQSWWQINEQGIIGWVSAPYVTQLGVCSNVLTISIPPSLPTVHQTKADLLAPPTFTIPDLRQSASTAYDPGRQCRHRLQSWRQIHRRRIKPPP